MASRLSLSVLVVCSLAVAQADLRLSNLRASNLPSDSVSEADAFIEIECGSYNLGKTHVNKNNDNPWWEEEYHLATAKVGDVLILEVIDEDVYSDDQIGTCTTSLKEGTHHLDCNLERGGVLYYTYSLN